MEVIIHEASGQKIAQIAGEGIFLGTAQEALDIMVDPGLGGANRIVIDRKNIIPDFFDLSTRIAGEILQKFVTYRVKLAIAGDFSDASESLKAFIYESNRGSQIFFCEGVPTAIDKLAAAK